MDETISTPLPETPEPAPENTETPEAITMTPAFQENNCCICNGDLEDGYSVLFRGKNDAEARICMKYREALRVISKCQNQDDLLQSGQYLASYYLSVAPIVLPYLDNFLEKGEDYLRKNPRDAADRP